MRKFIHVQDLTNEDYDLDLGYVAVDVDTGENCYFSHFNKDGSHNSKDIYPFDPKSISGDLAWHMARSGYPFSQISEEIHPEIVEFINYSIDAHREHNVKNGYRTDLLDFNKKHLKVIYVPSYTLFGREEASIYIPVENRISLYCDKLEYEEASKRVKNEEKSNVVHEIGHMKVSTYKIVGDKLYIKTGFFTSEANLESIVLDNGDIFYKIKEAPVKNRNLEKKALEEIINDTDCSNIYATYNRTYPNIGDSLNNLCDKKLPKLREEDNAFLAYCDYLKEIVKSTDIVDEINGLIKDALFGNNRRKYEGKALKLIRQCQDRKKC